MNAFKYGGWGNLGGFFSWPVDGLHLQLVYVVGPPDRVAHDVEVIRDGSGQPGRNRGLARGRVHVVLAKYSTFGKGKTNKFIFDLNHTTILVLLQMRKIKWCIFFGQLCVSHQEVDVPEGGRTNVVLLPSAHCIAHKVKEGRVRLWDQDLKHQIFPEKISFTWFLQLGIIGKDNIYKLRRDPWQPWMPWE